MGSLHAVPLEGLCYGESTRDDIPTDILDTIYGHLKSLYSSWLALHSGVQDTTGTQHWQGELCTSKQFNVS